MPLTMSMNEHIPEASPMSWMERLTLSMVRDSMNSALVQVSNSLLKLFVYLFVTYFSFTRLKLLLL